MKMYKVCSYGVSEVEVLRATDKTVFINEDNKELKNTVFHSWFADRRGAIDYLKKSINNSIVEENKRHANRIRFLDYVKSGIGIAVYYKRNNLKEQKKMKMYRVCGYGVSEVEVLRATDKTVFINENNKELKNTVFHRWFADKQGAIDYLKKSINDLTVEENKRHVDRIRFLTLALEIL